MDLFALAALSLPPVTTTLAVLCQVLVDPSLHGALAVTRLPAPPPGGTVPIFESISCHLPSEVHSIQIAMPT